jgi:hypothetical protein
MDWMEKSIIVIAVAGVSLCFAMAGRPRAETMPQTGVVLMAVDSIGEGWIVGAGDTCAAAASNAVYPADTVAVQCLPATSPMNHE